MPYWLNLNSNKYKSNIVYSNCLFLNHFLPIILRLSFAFCSVYVVFHVRFSSRSSPKNFMLAFLFSSALIIFDTNIHGGHSEIK